MKSVPITIVIRTVHEFSDGTNDDFIRNEVENDCCIDNIIIKLYNEIKEKKSSGAHNCILCNGQGVAVMGHHLCEKYAKLSAFE